MVTFSQVSVCQWICTQRGWIGNTTCIMGYVIMVGPLRYPTTPLGYRTPGMLYPLSDTLPPPLGYPTTRIPYPQDALTFCYWHLVEITGDLFKPVHFRPYAKPYWYLVVSTKASGTHPTGMLSCFPSFRFQKTSFGCIALWKFYFPFSWMLW